MSVAVDLIFESDDELVPDRRVRCNQGVVYETAEPGCPIDVASARAVAHHMINGDGVWGWRLEDDPSRVAYSRVFVMPATDEAATEIELVSKGARIDLAHARGQRTFGFEDGRLFAAPASSPAPSSPRDVIDHRGRARPPWREL